MSRMPVRIATLAPLVGAFGCATAAAFSATFQDRLLFATATILFLASFGFAIANERSNLRRYDRLQRRRRADR